MQTNKILATLFTVLLITTTASAAGETLHPESNKTIDGLTSNTEKSTALNDLFGLLSVTADTSGPYTPGEQINFNSEVVIDDSKTVLDGDAVLITEFYRCVDSGCDDGDQDEFLGTDKHFIDFGTDSELVRDWDTDYTWTAPNEESYYSAVAYMWDSKDNEVVSNSPKKIFKVGQETTEPDPEPEPEPDPDLEFSKTPGFNVDQSSNTVKGSIGIKNTGGTMEKYNYVEMQVRPVGENPLSFVGGQEVCDEDHPNNVGKIFRLDSGDSREINLESKGSLDDGKTYTVFFLTRTGCSPNERTEPIPNSYNAGSFTLEEPEPELEPDVVEQSKPQLSLNDKTITTQVSFKNKGGDMSENRIVEMQVRPKGSNPLAFSNTQKVCDESTPENVHKEFKLSSGESSSTTLSLTVSHEGDYTVYLLTRQGCTPDNEKVEPYYNSVQAGTVNIAAGGDGNGGSVGLPSTAALAGIGGVLVLILGIFAVVIGVVYR